MMRPQPFAIASSTSELVHKSGDKWRAEISSSLGSGRSDFNPTASYIRGDCGLAYDATLRMLALAVRERNKQVRSAVVGPAEIVEVNLYDSGTVIGHTSGGLIGGVVGGIGLGLSGGAKATMSVDVGLQIITKDAAWPMTFEVSRGRADFSDIIRRQALKDARHWYGIVSSMAANAGRDKTLSTGAQEDRGSRLVDQLRQLADLRQSGSLSLEQYESAKAQVLRENESNS